MTGIAIDDAMKQKAGVIWEHVSLEHDPNRAHLVTLKVLGSVSLVKYKIESGLLVSFLLYQFQLGENLRELGEVWNGLMQAVGASRKVFEFIDRDPRVKVCLPISQQ
ncbi:hypothetical protein OSTOST_00451 [Ostertagia ostertagi]